MSNESSNAVAAAALKNQTNRAIEHLMGMVTGMVADANLHDLEIKMLSTWIAANQAACQEFPGSVIARKVHEVLEDGIITEAERTHLLDVLSGLAANQFAVTGSASPEVATLPIEDSVTIDFPSAMVCLTGDFLYGTRAACERLLLKTGAMCIDSVSKKVDILIIGTRVSPQWAHTSFGRKIQKAVELQENGHPIEIISERRMMEVLTSHE